MVDEYVLDLVRKYLHAISLAGIHITRAILFGSQSRGLARLDSDIDLLLISPLFDEEIDSYMGRIWSLTSVADYRIEPFAVGEKRFQEDNVSTIIEIARNEGIEIPKA